MSSPLFFPNGRRALFAHHACSLLRPSFQAPRPPPRSAAWVRTGGAPHLIHGPVEGIPVSRAMEGRRGLRASSPPVFLTWNSPGPGRQRRLPHDRRVSLREVFYMVTYSRGPEICAAVLAIANGRIAGGDMKGGVYKGTYEKNPQTGQYDAKFTVNVVPGEQTIFGPVTPPKGLILKAKCSIDENPEGILYDVETELGVVSDMLLRLRDIS